MRLCRAISLSVAMWLPWLSSHAVYAEHEGDIWVGRSASGQLKIDPQGYTPADSYTYLPAISGLFNGWGDNDPGFDHLTADDPANGVFPLESGAEIWLEVVTIDAAFRMIVPGSPFVYLDSPGDETLLGNHTLHIHNNWHINSDDPGYDPDQCVWHGTFLLRDDGGTGYDTSEPFAMSFTNVELQDLDGDFDDDDDVDYDDLAALNECLAGPGVLPDPNNPSITECEVECLNAFDFDDDRDVDLNDVGQFQAAFTG